jgi:hypothetical protein
MDDNNIFEFPNLFPIEEQQQQLGARRPVSINKVNTEKESIYLFICIVDLK